MRNIIYFCIVKHPKFFFIALFLSAIFLHVSEVYARCDGETYHEGCNDSVEISLLTCSPGTEVYSLYGHTAIRYTNYAKNIDVVVNYGMFSFRQKYFILRFIFGLTDYEMGVVPFEFFYNEYKRENRYVVQQVLNLTKEEKDAVVAALDQNYLPENRVYRYNCFYDNCTTRARDIIFRNIRGKVLYANDKSEYPSFRSLTHSFNGDHPWARFGNDLLLGVNADKATDRNENQFLPFNLENDFADAKIVNAEGVKRPLVKATFKVIENTRQEVRQEDFLRPGTCAMIVFCLIVLVTSFEFFYKKNLWLFDSFLMFASGCAGFILFLMIFSQHPTTSINFQILLLNPLNLLLVYRVSKRLKQKRADNFWIYASLVIILFFIAGIFQKYAEGMYILALSLLVRCLWRTIYLKTDNDK